MSHVFKPLCAGLQALGAVKWQNLSAGLWELPNASSTLDGVEISWPKCDTPLIKWIPEETTGLPNSGT